MTNNPAVKQCCTWSEPCAEHKARISPELQAKLDAVDTEEEKTRVAMEYIMDAFERGEWSFKL